MYSESDLESAVAAGVLQPQAAQALRDHVAASRAAPIVDEEHFRLLTGFNDIFVAIAAVILLVAVSWIGREAAIWVGAFAVAGTSWALSEYFTRQRRMALPSIILLLAFVGSVFVGVVDLAVGPDGLLEASPQVEALFGALAAAVAAVAAWFHWRRFRVPITVAAGAAALTGVVLALFASVLGENAALETALLVAALVAGLAVFLLAMRWDASDPVRRTRRSDVAFWLHLLAAPLIVHPIFSLLGVTDGSATPVQAIVVLMVYVALGVTALAIDRRALLVSALAYVLYALTSLVEQAGAVELSFAITALIIGSALLLLSAFWHSARRGVVEPLPANLRAKLPLVERVKPQPAS
jgi:hypothetical protein